MRILVTGGAGFIGSNLAKYLVAHGHKVVVMDDAIPDSKVNAIGSVAIEPQGLVANVATSEGENASVDAIINHRPLGLIGHAFISSDPLGSGMGVFSSRPGGAVPIPRLVSMKHSLRGRSIRAPRPRPVANFSLAPPPSLLPPRALAFPPVSPSIAMHSRRLALDSDSPTSSEASTHLAALQQWKADAEVRIAQLEREILFLREQSQLAKSTETEVRRENGRKNRTHINSFRVIFLKNKNMYIYLI